MFMKKNDLSRCKSILSYIYENNGDTSIFGVKLGGNCLQGAPKRRFSCFQVPKSAQFRVQMTCRGSKFQQICGGELTASTGGATPP
jgi:hypothetical protein